ncbi:unnamed protein product [Rhizophagus irregularis]|nr:unnamed protein product [Rhizophagus irregularis]
MSDMTNNPPNLTANIQNLCYTTHQCFIGQNNSAMYNTVTHYSRYWASRTNSHLLRNESDFAYEKIIR